MGNRAAKGSDFEREVCGAFSLWWTNNERDDIFWRSSGSGARAKTRGNAGRNTAGQHGDIAATDPIGAPLIKLLTIELKRGYTTAGPLDLVDRTKTSAIQTWEGFILQTLKSAKQAKSHSWMLITRRDRRRPWVWVPTDLYEDIKTVGGFAKPPVCYLSLATNVREKRGPVHVAISGVPLSTWLSGVTREHIEQLVRELC